MAASLLLLLKVLQANTVRFKMLNNPGLCAMNFNFEYDKNALTIVDAYSVGEFDKIANTSLTY